ncbi:hypothetical protein [Actinomadura rayongensis]|uniref:hypothetical protein n=1 Tax=Actinomadura rayongensis TaxID=1429076 RepID=UPI00136DE455|nr:hypothetical protein [Actinomadura rayongensis]
MSGFRKEITDAVTIRQPPTSAQHVQRFPGESANLEWYPAKDWTPARLNNYDLERPALCQREVPTTRTCARVSHQRTMPGSEILDTGHGDRASSRDDQDR